jgi:hypothetical protein
MVRGVYTMAHLNGEAVANEIHGNKMTTLSKTNALFSSFG